MARKCNEQGLSVAVIEKNGWGGVCPLRGCEPKKTLVEAAHAVDAVRRMRGNGIEGQVSIDWGALIRFKEEFTDPVSDAVENSLMEDGIATYQGRCVFTGPNSVDVLPTDDEESPASLEARRFCLAVGTRPRPFSFPGAELMTDSDGFLNLEKLPKRLVFIGGGFVSFEFALIALAAGSEVKLATHGERFLRNFDPDLVETLLKACHEKGLNTQRDFTPSRLERKGDSLVLYGSEGDSRSFEADMVINGAGRVPQTADIQLDRAGVELKNLAVAVNDGMQSVGNEAVYAAGDCVDQGWPLTPVAVHQGQVAVRNILLDLAKAEGPRAEVDYSGAANALFSDPPLARAGLLEKEAEELGAPLKRYQGDASKWSEYRRLGRKHAGYKVLVREDTGHILGAHFLGDGAEELASLTGLAIRQGITVEELMQMLWAYPSFAYTLRYIFR